MSALYGSSDGCPEDLFGPCGTYATIDDVRVVCDTGGLELDPGDPGAEPPVEPGADVELVERMLIEATRRMYLAEGGNYTGCCETKFRPCRRTCGKGLAPLLSFPVTGITELDEIRAVVWQCSCPVPVGCSCSTWDRLAVPFRYVTSVVEVKIDGVVLAPSAYRLADGWLLRIDGDLWPECNATELADTEPGTWSVTVLHGLGLPPEGVSIAAQFAVELAKACRGSECRLGPGIKVVHRAGVEYEIIEPVGDSVSTGFGPADDWIELVHGGHVSEPPRMYRPGRDAPGYVIERFTP